MKMLFLLPLLISSLGIPENTSIPNRVLPTRLLVKTLFVKRGFLNSRKQSIDTVVIHSSYNALGGDVYSVEKLLVEYARYGVSSHYLIDREGQVYQLVPDAYCSYHAGASRMTDGRTRVNNFSLGIELMNTREDQYTEVQYQSLRSLIQELKKSYPIKHIVGHGQIAPGRRSDPWNFNWKNLKDLM